VNCSNCGKSLGFHNKGIEVQEKNKTLNVCADCFLKLRKEYSSKKTCSNCINFEGYDHCAKLSRALDPVQIQDILFTSPERYFFEAEECTHYTNKGMTKEFTNKAIEEELPWKNALMLEANEKVIQYWQGNHETQMMTSKDTWLGKQPTTVKQTKMGTLVLTNQRLAWIEMRGVFNKSHHYIFAILLDKLQGISMGGSITKYVSIADSQNEHIFHLSGVYSAGLDSFKRVVYDQVKARKQELENEKKRDKVQIVLDFSFLRTYMEKGGLSLQVLKCPECGGPIKIPQSGNNTVCQHCGNNVYAQDIFEKVKALIG